MQTEDELEVPARSWPTRVKGWLRELALTGLLLVVLMQGMSWLRAPDLPEHAPGFVLEDLSGQRVSLADLAGQTVVLNFWATWCGPCRVEAPWFASFSKDHPEIVVLGVAVDGTPPQLKRAAQELGISYPILRGTPEMLQAYEVSAYPTTVVVNPDGRVGSAHVGLMMRPQLAWATGVWW